MKILLEVSREVWGRVKFFATVESLTTSRAVEILLQEALKEKGHSISEMETNG